MRRVSELFSRMKMQYFTGCKIYVDECDRPSVRLFEVKRTSFEKSTVDWLVASEGYPHNHSHQSSASCLTSVITVFSISL